MLSNQNDIIVKKVDNNKLTKKILNLLRYVL